MKAAAAPGGLIQPKNAMLEMDKAVVSGVPIHAGRKAEANLVLTK